MSLLSILQTASAEIGVPSPIAAFGSGNQQTQQMIALANREGRELARDYNWQILVKEGTFATVAAEDQGDILTIAPDFDRFVNQTFFNRSQQRRVWGPISEERWQHNKAWPVSTIYNEYRLRGNDILFYPAPSAGEAVYFEYVSKHWCQSAAGVGQAAFAADTDVPILDEDLITLGLIWRFRKAKRMDYGAEFDEYARRRDSLQGRDGSKPTIRLSRLYPNILPSENVAEGNWPSSP